MITLEVCLASADDAAVVQRAGADRIELNAALELGGLTPSIGMLRTVRREVGLPVVAMNRPRPGDFRYSRCDFAVMEADAEAMVEAGADGFAFGILTEDGRVDMKRCRGLIDRAADKQGVFHRAFDTVADPLDALEALIDIGFTRVLTSGSAPTAMQGTNAIRTLIERADGRIEVLPGGGIGPGNVREIVAATGCTQVHGTFRAAGRKAKTTGRAAVIESPPESPGTGADTVAAVRAILDSLA